MCEERRGSSMTNSTASQLVDQVLDQKLFTAIGRPVTLLKK